MKIRTIYPELENGQSRGVIMNNEKGPVLVKVHRSGYLFYLNPPPVDMRCEICGRLADDIEPFNENFIEKCKAEERTQNEQFQSSQSITKYISADYKLSKHFRIFHKNMVEASWECKECFTLSDKEALEAKKDRERS